MSDQDLLDDWLRDLAHRRRVSAATLRAYGADLRAFVGVVSCLTALLANDSGAMHLGAALGVPTVGIFGPTNPDETRPLGGKTGFVRGVAECSPCRHAVCPIDHRCMTSIAPPSVVETLLRAVRS